MQRKVGIVQRVLTTYRKPFFDSLAAQPDFLVNVCAGQPMRQEPLKVAESLSKATFTQITNHYVQEAENWVCWQKGIHKWLHTVNPDIVVLEANPRLISNWNVIKWMHRRGRPVLGWGLGSLPHTGSSWANSVRNKYYRQLIKSMDGMIAYSSKARNDYIAYGMHPAHVIVAHNSMDNAEAEKYVSALGSDPSWLVPWKRELGLQPDLPTVLFVGRLIKPKRVDTLLESCAPLLHKCQVLIVGDGPTASALEQQATQYEHAERVIFTKHLSGEALARCYIASDLFVLPGAGGLAIQQAMSYGLPIVVSFGDGTETDLVREGVNGHYFTANDVADLRSVISSLLDDPSLRKEMGCASGALVRSEINLKQMVMSYSDALALFARH